MKRLAYALSVVFFALQACKKEGCDDPIAFNYDPEGTSNESCVWEPVPVEIHFTTSYGDVEVTTGEGGTELETDDGRSLIIDYFGMYITELSIVGYEATTLLGSESDNCIIREDDAHLLTGSNRTYVGSYLPSPGSSFDALKFNIGVDSCRNNGLDPSTKLSGPFAPKSPTMYWSWASGYRFFTLEGMVDTSAAADGTGMTKFEYHTGMDALLRDVNLAVESLRVEEGKVVFYVDMDFKMVLADVDFKTELSTHTMDNMPLAVKISNNTQQAFTIE
ncbi:MAG: hypothetical protein RLP15_01905 [Cryomorphaceae bacterium]